MSTSHEISHHIESAKDASTGRRNEAVPFLFLYVITSTDDRRRRHEMKLQLHIRGVCSRSYRFSIPLLQIFPLFSLLGSKTNRDLESRHRLNQWPITIIAPVLKAFVYNHGLRMALFFVLALDRSGRLPRTN